MRPEPAIDLNKTSDQPVRASLASDILDFDVLKAFEKVKSDDGSDILIELIDLYLNSTAQRIKEIRTAAEGEEWCVIKRLAHTLKGSSSTLGLRGVAKACQQLEDISSTSDPIANKLLETLDSRFAEARKALIAEHRRRMGQLEVTRRYAHPHARVAISRRD